MPTLLPVRPREAWLAFDAVPVREITGPSDWLPIPGSPARLPGVLAWRGRAVAVLDLCVAIGDGAAPLSPGTVRHRTLIVGLSHGTLAIPVDAVREVESVSDELIRAPHATRVAHARGEVELEGRWLPVLDLEALVGAALPHKGAG